MSLKKIVSGGQTGADKAGLVAARDLGLETGGYAPKGWRICLPDGSDGSDLSLQEYGLVEHESQDYPPRTVLNVKSSDGTVWFGYEKSPGGRLTLRTAEAEGKPSIINPTASELREWVAENNIQTLNVAGNRQSPENPNIFEVTYQTIYEAFEDIVDLQDAIAMDSKNEKSIQDDCNHGVKFDADAAKNLSATEVRRLYPRFSGKCEKCGYEGDWNFEC